MIKSLYFIYEAGALPQLFRILACRLLEKKIALQIYTKTILLTYGGVRPFYIEERAITICIVRTSHSLMFPEDESCPTGTVIPSMDYFYWSS
jgi:hypothetical protein